MESEVKISGRKLQWGLNAQASHCNLFPARADLRTMLPGVLVERLPKVLAEWLEPFEEGGGSPERRSDGPASLAKKRDPPTPNQNLEDKTFGNDHDLEGHHEP